MVAMMGKRLSGFLRAFAVAIVLLVLALLTVVFSSGHRMRKNVVEPGIENAKLVLTESSLETGPLISLAGEWGYYPDIFLEKEGDGALLLESERYTALPPHRVSNASASATYRLLITADPLPTDIVLFIPNFYGTANVFFNGTLVSPLDATGPKSENGYICQLGALHSQGSQELLISIKSERGQMPLYKRNIFLTSLQNAIHYANTTMLDTMLLFGLMLLLLVSSCIFMIFLPNHKLITLITLFDSMIIFRIFFSMPETLYFIRTILPWFQIPDRTSVSMQLLFLMLGGVVGTLLSREIFDPTDQVPRKLTRPLPFFYLLLAIVFPLNLTLYDLFGIPILLLGYGITFFVVFLQFIVCLKNPKNRRLYYYFQIVKTGYVGVLICIDILTLNSHLNFYIMIILYMIFFSAHLFIRLYDNNISYAEVAALNENLERTVEERTCELSEANKMLSELSVRDPLTQSYNRLHFEQQIERALSLDANVRMYLCMFDLDFFKKINDQFGHETGDEQLKFVVKTVTQRLETSETLFRIGGEEFVILFVDESEESMLERIRDIHRELQKSAKHDKKRTTASFGITQRRENDTRKLFLQRADHALYAAKERGRNRIVFEDEVVS